MSAIIAVDIGGTSVRAALFEKDKTRPTETRRMETRSAPGTLFTRIVELIRLMWPAGSVEAIGVAAPGPLEPDKGLILKAPNISEWVDFPIVERLRAEFATDAFLDNDANLAAFAEWKFGAGRGHANLLHVTVGTGVGSGLIINNQLHHGFHGLAAEFGHMTLDPGGPMCGCGHAGHVESYASGRAIAAFTLQQIRTGTKSVLAAKQGLSAKDVADAAREGDTLAQTAFERAGAYLGMGIANCLVLLDPSIIIIGGGVAAAGDLLLRPMEESLRRHALHRRYLEAVTVTLGELGDEAGLLGASALARAKLEASPDVAPAAR